MLVFFRPAGQTSPSADVKRKFERIRTLLQLADEAEVKETNSLRQTNKAIRSHGETVEEVDITTLIPRRPRRDLAQHNWGSAAAGFLQLPIFIKS